MKACGTLDTRLSESSFGFWFGPHVGTLRSPGGLHGGEFDINVE